MGANPAEQKVLKADRIYSYEEFHELRQKVGGSKSRKGLISFKRRRQLVPFALRITYRSAMVTGAALLFLALGAYGILTTSVVNQSYKLVNVEKSLNNLSLALAGEEMANNEARGKLVYSPENASALGLVPATKAQYIVRTNIPAKRGDARTVDELYPLSKTIIQIEP